MYASRYLRREVEPMQGPDVLELQSSLKALGLFAAEEDGVFGDETHQAVLRFQQAMHLEVDGIVDPDTWNQLHLYHPPATSTGFGNGQAENLPRIIIDIDRRILVFSSSSFVKTYPVAVGKRSTPTPLGNWTIVYKSVNPGGPFGARWMRLSVPWGGYGIHGTNNPKSIGKAVSHGCVRMYNEDVIEVYDRTPLGTPVTIVGKAYARRVLQPGDRGSDVREVQKMLKSLGYYRAKLDGHYGSYTRQAVAAFQKSHEITSDGMVGPETLAALQKAYAVAGGSRQP